MCAEGSARRGAAGSPRPSRPSRPSRPFPAAPAPRVPAAAGPAPAAAAGGAAPPSPSFSSHAGQGQPRGRRGGRAGSRARLHHVRRRGCPPGPSRAVPHHEGRACGAAPTPRSGRARAAPPPPVLRAPAVRRRGRGSRRLLRLPHEAAAEPHGPGLRRAAPEPALPSALHHQRPVSLLWAGPPHVQGWAAWSQHGRAQGLRGAHLSADCLSYTALEVLSERCYGKQRCKVIVTSRDFGSPCLPGVTKSLNVSYACVPKFILTAVNPLVPGNKSSINQNDGVDLDPRESRLPKKDGTVVSSNYLATFAYIRDHPERLALLFVSSVCVGLIFTLCALVICVLCPGDIRKLHGNRDQLVPHSARAHRSTEPREEEEEEEEGEDSSLSDTQDETDGLYRPPYSGYNSAEAAELAERIERREQIIQEIWMNSGLDMTPPRNMNTFYINEQ
uniref:SUEL-type lectin domain-containing protein n=1 Tax=Junco hyemalis TaxID=40217 RepID=A0A8C5NS10_JUNHY